MQKIIQYQDFITRLCQIYEEMSSNYNLDIYLPTKDLKYKEVQNKEDIVDISLDSIRMTEPVKTFFFRPKEDLLRYEKENFLQIIVGIKSCDLSAIKVLDAMFLEKGYVDSSYKFFRDRTIIISCDCPKPEKNCFCSLINNTPYPTSGYDLNLEFVDDTRFILSSGSVKGEDLLDKYFLNYDAPTKDDIVKRDNLHILSVQNVKEINKEYLLEHKDDYYRVVKESYDINNIWQEESSTCVQCKGCNFICPSCYCFFIRESSKDFENQYRDRVWDACHSTGYGRVAGGGNSRKYKFQRFRNRYQCKFVYRKDNFNFYACTGCGRCIEVCPGKIDIRKVVKSLTKVITYA